MKSQLLLPLIAVATLMAVAIPARAKSGDMQRVTIELGSTATISNTTLNPGEYTVVVEGDHAKFEQNGKVVAQAPCAWKTLSTKAPDTEVETDQNRIKQIDISGKTQAIQFPS